MAKLKHYGGSGYTYSTEVGTYEVKATKTKTFNSLSEARKYYDALDEPKALWDRTNAAPDLLDCHTCQK